MDKYANVVGAPADSAVTPGQRIAAVDPRYFHPTEVASLLGDPSKAKAKLGWSPRITFPQMVSEMVQCDLTQARRNALIHAAGYHASHHHE